VRSDGGRLLAAELHLPFVGVVPIDAELAACEDAGQNFFVVHPESDSLQTLRTFAATLAPAATRETIAHQ
jgi:hypothetical protein